MNRREVMVGAAAVALLPAVPAAASVLAPQVKTFIMPAFYHWRDDRLRLEEENTITYVHPVMERWIISGPTTNIWRAPTLSDTYAEWLAEDYNQTEREKEHGIPPHIGFGGAIKSVRGGDPTFYPRWIERTKRHMAEGLFDRMLKSDTRENWTVSRAMVKDRERMFIWKKRDDDTI